MRSVTRWLLGVGLLLSLSADSLQNQENETSPAFESVNGAFLGQNLQPRQRVRKILQHNLNTYIHHIFADEEDMQDPAHGQSPNGTGSQRELFKRLLEEKTHGQIHTLPHPETGDTPSGGGNFSEDARHIDLQFDLSSRTNNNSFNSHVNNMALWLFNVMSFNGKWQYPFNEQLTHPDYFLVEGEHPVLVETMTSRAQYPRQHYEELEMQLLELPYGEDGRYGLFILLPDEDQGLPKLERRLSHFTLERVLSEFHPLWHIKVNLPRFSFRTELDLVDAMKRLGFRRMFSPRDADFSGLTSTKENPSDLSPSSPSRKRRSSDQTGIDRHSTLAVDGDVNSSPANEILNSVPTLQLGRTSDQIVFSQTKKKSSREPKAERRLTKIRRLSNQRKIHEMPVNEAKTKTKEGQENQIKASHRQKHRKTNKGKRRMRTRRATTKGSSEEHNSETEPSEFASKHKPESDQQKGNANPRGRSLTDSPKRTTSPYVSQMLHKAVIEVNERGTAASAVSASLLTIRRFVPTVRADHPFMFVIRDKKMGINLFIGRVTDPRDVS